jgi:hypothetical protein
MKLSTDPYKHHQRPQPLFQLRLFHMQEIIWKPTANRSAFHAIRRKFYTLLEWERFTISRTLGVGVLKSIAHTIAISLEYHPNKSLNSYSKESLCIMCRPAQIPSSVLLLLIYLTCPISSHDSVVLCHTLEERVFIYDTCVKTSHVRVTGRICFAYRLFLRLELKLLKLQ